MAGARKDRFQIAGHFPLEVRRAFSVLCAKNGWTVQRGLAIAMNDLLEKHGAARAADEGQLARGGAAQKLMRDRVGT
jgi:hypothetical protein